MQLSFYRSKFVLVALTLILSIPLTAQTVRDMSEVNETFRYAQELQRKKLYGLAQMEYERVLAKAESWSPMFVANTEFHILECAYEQWAPNTEVLIEAYIQKYHESVWQNSARYLLGKLYYRGGQYDKALEMFDNFEPRSLSEADFQEYTFQKAYSLFVLNKYDKASPLFSLLKDEGSKYASAATYYYAHIAYEEKRFAVALKGFEALRSDETFSRLVPYYILHIYHYQKNYDKVIEEGVAFMDKASEKRQPEVARLIGEAYYCKKQYAEALHYIERFAATAPDLTRADKYLLGYIYYQNKNYSKAADIFGQITVGQDSIAQSAYYYLADAFMQQGDKQNAGRAFLQASKMDFFPEIKEDAMFSYAKLMFELNSDPFNDAIDALNQYLVAYPNSRRTDEVNKCLMQAYIHSKNYKAALSALQAINTPDADVYAALQKVAYLRAVELFQNQSYAEAMKMFDLSLQYSSYNSTTAALAKYWKGEAAYREGDYSLAQNLFNDFVLSAGISQTPEYKVAHYSLGYSLFQQKQYANATGWFRKYIAFASDKPNAMLCDAYNRVGDCNFMLHGYSEAIENYKKVIALNIVDADYAAFQSGICYGLVNEQDRKIDLMNTVINFRPASTYLDNALYEKGRCYVQMQQYGQAINAYTQLLSKFPQSLFYAKTLIELGLIYVNKGDNKEALDYYKRVVKDFSGTSESRSALLGVKNIYVEMGDVDAYVKYVSGIKNVGQVNASERDSMTFDVAERFYVNNDCDKANLSLQKYLKEFPLGAFVVDAHFYLADCDYRAGKLDEAVQHFAYVLKMPKSSYTEPSLLGAARASFEMGDNAKAANYYEQLEQIASTKATLVEARVGKLRANYLSRNYMHVPVDADAVLAVDNLAPELSREAHFKRAKAQDALGNADKAQEDYLLVANSVATKEGAESQYRAIGYLFNKNKLDETEKAILAFAQSGTPHQYWLAKSFIILGDIYVKRNDAFQAKATYESILDGYTVPNDGIVDEVTGKMQQLMNEEKAKEEKVPQPESLNVVL